MLQYCEKDEDDNSLNAGRIPEKLSVGNLVCPKCENKVNANCIDVKRNKFPRN